MCWCMHMVVHMLGIVSDGNGDGGGAMHVHACMG